MGASLFSENEPRSFCVPQKWEEWTLISSSDPSVNVFTSQCPLLSYCSPHLLLEIAIIKLLWQGPGFLDSCRQAVRTGEACHLFAHQWLVSAACWIVLLWVVLFAERLTLPSELTEASPESLATKMAQVTDVRFAQDCSVHVYSPHLSLFCKEAENHLCFMASWCHPVAWLPSSLPPSSP